MFVMVAATTDIVGVVAVITGLAGALSGIGAILVQRRDATTRHESSYVERNLAAMQAYIDLQEDEIKSLRAANTVCQDALAECLRRRRPNRPS